MEIIDLPLKEPPVAIAAVFVTIAVASALVAIFAATFPSESIAYFQGVPVSTTNFVVAKYAAIVTASSLGVLLIAGAIMLVINRARTS